MNTRDKTGEQWPCFIYLCILSDKRMPSRKKVFKYLLTEGEKITEKGARKDFGIKGC